MLEQIKIPCAARGTGVYTIEKEVLKMDNDEKNVSSSDERWMESFTVQLSDPMLYDRLHTLSGEYSVSIELLINVAVKRLIEDIDFVRSLRIGKTKLE